MRPLFVVLIAATLAAPAYAQEEGGRPQGDNPQTGTAVPRRGPPPPSTSAPPASTPPDSPRAVNRSRGRPVIVQPPAVYGYPYQPYPPYYSRYSPYRPYYPNGYGAFGMGFLYYDPYRWHPGAHSAYSYGARPLGAYSVFDIGELRLDVSPRHGQVFVDGYYAGIVDDFDGAFQAITLAPGAYRIEIVAPGYETLSFDVRITPSQKIRYRGELYRRP